MAQIVKDRVRDTWTGTGTGAMTVSGTAPTGHIPFSSVCAVSDTVRVIVHNQAVPSEWEVSNATYSASNQLTRTTIEASSNAGAAVNFSAGTKDVVHCITAASLASGGGGTPGGSTLQLQYNNAGAFAGMAGSSWDDTNRALTIGGATVTAIEPILDLSQTWNNAAVAFRAFKLNVIGTVGTTYLDNVSSLFTLSYNSVEKVNVFLENGEASVQAFQFKASGSVLIGNGEVGMYNAAFRLGTSGSLIFTNGGSFVDTADIFVTRDAAGILAQRNGANAQTLRVYNTYTGSGDYERGVFDWTTASDTLTIGAQALGSGTLRALNLVGSVLTFNGSAISGGGGLTNFASDGTTLSGSGQTVTTSKPVLDLTQTWNAGAVAFTGIKLNITNTASAAATSKLLDLQIGGASVFSVYKNTVASDDATMLFGAATLRSSGGNFIVGASGIYDSAQTAAFGGGLTNGGLTDGGFHLRSTSGLGWSNSAQWYGTKDIMLYRDAAGILAQRNGTNAQTFRVYNTYTNSTNYERGVFSWDFIANNLTIGVQAAGTGTNRSLFFLGQFATFYTDTTLAARATVHVASIGANGVGYLDATRGGAAGPYAVHRFLDDNGLLPSAYFNWGGQARVTSDFSKTSSVTLSDVTGLSVQVAAGRTYSFEAKLFVTDAAAGGVQAAIAGTATATAIQYAGYTVADNAIKGLTNATALGVAVASTLTTITAGIMVQIFGTVTVNAAGTLTVQMAQNTSNATATVAKRGSYFIVHDMP